VTAADEAVTAADEAVTAADEAVTAAAVAEVSVAAVADEAATAVDEAAVAVATVANLAVNHSNLQTVLAKALVKVKPIEAMTPPKAAKVVPTESERLIPLLTPIRVPKRFHDLQ
jgi:hypothetical protein